MKAGQTTDGGRRPEKALSAAFVRQVTTPGKYFDGHGLYLRVQPNGARQWVQRIVIRGKRGELGLGNPSLVSLAEVREQALANHKLARAGGNPLQAKREADMAQCKTRRAIYQHTGNLRFPKYGPAAGGRCDNGGCAGRTFPDLDRKARDGGAGAATHRHCDEMGGGSTLAAG